MGIGIGIGIGLGSNPIPTPYSNPGRSCLKPGGVTHGVAARRATLRAPAWPAAAAGARGRRVEAQAGDHGVGVTGVRVDGDPLALAGLAPALEARRVERLAQQSAAVQRVAHRARAVIARVLPLAVAAAVLVRLPRDAVGGGNRVLDLLRSAVGSDRRAAIRGQSRLARGVGLSAWIEALAARTGGVDAAVARC